MGKYQIVSIVSGKEDIMLDTDSAAEAKDVYRARVRAKSYVRARIDGKTLPIFKGDKWAGQLQERTIPMVKVKKENMHRLKPTQESRERQAAKTRAYYQKNREKILARKKEIREQDPGRFKAYKKAYRERLKEIIVYDMRERTYMLRNGFRVVDICANEGTLYMINDRRFVYQWDESRTYDGDPINAYWQTPFTDLGSMSTSKVLKFLYFRGEGGIVRIRRRVGIFEDVEAYQMPANTGEPKAVQLLNEGKAFSLRIFNEAGSWFRILGGVEMQFEVKGD